MGNRRPWQEKFKAFMADVADRAGVERPRIVVLPKRASGPRQTPPDWYLEEVNKLLPKKDQPELPPAA